MRAKEEGCGQDNRGGDGRLPDCRKKGSERDESELSKATVLTRRKKGIKAILAMHGCKGTKHPAFFESWQVLVLLA